MDGYAAIFVVEERDIDRIKKGVKELLFLRVSMT